MLAYLEIEFSANPGKVFKIGVCEFDSGFWDATREYKSKRDCPKD